MHTKLHIICTAAILTAAALPMTARAEDTEMPQYPIAEGMTEGIFAYDLYSNHAVLTGIDGAPVSLDIPAELGGQPVTALGEYALKGQAQLTSVTVPEGVTALEAGAFYECSALTEIALPHSLEMIGESAFYECTALKQITIPTAGVIGRSAFFGCEALTEVRMPEHMTALGYMSFGKCTALTEITVPEGITELPISVFSHCTALRTVSLPESLTAIQNAAFHLCQSLEEITLPENLQTMERMTFSGCSALENLTLPASLREIPESMLLNCGKMGTLTVCNPDAAFPASIGKVTEIRGISGSTAEAYAGQHGVQFTALPANLPGDLNRDGALTLADAVQLGRLLAEDPAASVNPDAADTDSDGILNILDLDKLLREIAEKSAE